MESSSEIQWNDGYNEGFDVGLLQGQEVFMLKVIEWARKVEQRGPALVLSNHLDSYAIGHSDALGELLEALKEILPESEKRYELWIT